MRFSRRRAHGVALIRASWNCWASAEIELAQPIERSQLVRTIYWRWFCTRERDEQPFPGCEQALSPSLRQLHF